MSGAFAAQQGIAVSLPHPVRDINGNYVAGQASALTKSLLKPDRTAASETVTLSDIGATGWAQASVAPTLIGAYTLALTNPAFPTADGRTEEYSIVVGPGMAAGTLLTSLDRVRTRMQLKNADGSVYAPGDVSPYDTLLLTQISEISAEYLTRIGRRFIEQGVVEYLDGDGLSRLLLNEGPLVSLASMELVDYRDDGAGGVTEVYTTVPRNSYVLSGLRSENHRGRGRLDRISGNFTWGRRNHRISYTAGFAAVPEDVAGMATIRVIYEFQTKEIGYLMSQQVGDGQQSLRGRQFVWEDEHRVLDSYRW